MSADILQKELETFEAHKSELISKGQGKFALIHDGKVVEIYNDEQDAIREGYKQFGNVPFLVKQILAVEMPANFVNNHIGF